MKKIPDTNLYIINKCELNYNFKPMKYEELSSKTLALNFFKLFVIYIMLFQEFITLIIMDTNFFYYFNKKIYYNLMLKIYMLCLSNSLKNLF